jgi:hypothetical protein
MKTKMVYLTVAVEIDAEADEQEVIQDCDYFFDSPAIKNTEIQEIFNEKEMQYFKDNEPDLYGLGASRFADGGE